MSHFEMVYTHWLKNFNLIEDTINAITYNKITLIATIVFSLAIILLLLLVLILKK